VNNDLSNENDNEEIIIIPTATTTTATTTDREIGINKCICRENLYSNANTKTIYD
jgi:hypothetical protein